ncbi:AraC family transcriptional regulator [Cryptosporangium sp. NPDC051539]|uniref:AraC family transcriptional regulator n=1 Tax=Cryptosporangium sp. NPDC051539 TaxID=3363962 RepID=UPI003797B551
MSRLSKLGFIDTARTSRPVRRRIRSRGVPTALAGHEVICTDDPAEAEHVVGRMLGAHRLTVHPSTERFQATLHAVRLRDVTFAYLDYHLGATLEFAATGDHYSVHMPMNGTAECLYDDQPISALSYRGLVVNPRTRLTMTTAYDAPQLIVRVEVQALERQLARMLGRTVDKPVRFAPAMDLSRDPAVRWHGALQLLSTEVMTPESLIQQGIGGGPIEELIISSLLWIQESNVHDELTTSVRRSERAVVRRSINFIEENLAGELSVSDIARAANVSVRSIQQGFRDDLGTTPMTYIRERRLERVRAVLADAVPSDGVTVTDVAERWGFSHLGNFSLLYRKRFGESPSATLRR